MFLGKLSGLLKIVKSGHIYKFLVHHPSITTTMSIKTKKRLTDWQVLEQMANENKDIRAFRHILGVEMKGKKGNKYNELKIQIDPETHDDIANMIMFGMDSKKKIVVCYVIDREQFDKIKNAP